MELPEEKKTAVSLTQGLSESQVAERVSAGLVNIQEDQNSKSVQQIIRSNLMTFFNMINLILAVLIICVGSFKNLFFMGIVICNTAIGIFQEIRAKRTLDKLSLITAAKVSVIRDGEKSKIDIFDLVQDDIMLLGAGNQICADAVVREGMVEVNEALISGESDIIAKHPGDPLYSGSFVVSGKAKTQVVHVGKDSFANRL